LAVDLDGYGPLEVYPECGEHGSYDYYYGEDDLEESLVGEEHSSPWGVVFQKVTSRFDG
jgi:hypothetical protein